MKPFVNESPLIEEWNYGKNSALGFSPDKLTQGSSLKVWWVCDKKHEWEAEIGSRCLENKKCPYCSGNKIMVGFNDLATTCPEVATQWHLTKNGELLPTQVSKGSNKKVWWLGDCGHEWESVVKTKIIRNEGCPICSGRKVLTGLNDINTTHPDVASQWHPTKNSFSPMSVSAGSDRQVWWVCDKKHEWKTKISGRTSGAGCPVCAGKKILEGVNDIAFANLDLMKEWDYEKNSLLGILPTNLTSGSAVKAWWICENGHEWETRICDRTRPPFGRKCPSCSSRVSNQEKELVAFLQQYVSVETSIRNIIKGELDIYIPEKKFAIEFNGVYWHSEAMGKGKTYHYDKWKACKDKGIQLIQIWEDDWMKNPELIKNLLLHKLGISTAPKIFARKTTVKHLSQPEVNSFLSENHIQGAAQGSVRLGLTVTETDGEPNFSPVEKLVAVMVLKVEPGTGGKTLNLLRFATSQPVVGGFTKLLKQAELVESVEQIITFSDNTVSDGGLYESTGFIADKQLPPDYMYVVGGARKHKFGYRLKKFRDDPTLKHAEGLTERELAKLNNIHRIWDAGKTRWVKQTK